MHEPFYYYRHTQNSRWEFSEKDEVSFYMKEVYLLNKDIETDVLEKVYLRSDPYTPRRLHL